MLGKDVVVLRYGHRIMRDYRVTTHCCLVARAFGADRIIIDGEEDKSIIDSVNNVGEKFGKGFDIEFTKSWTDVLEKFKKKGYLAIHLTMYGEKLLDKLEKINKGEKLIVLVGSQKVESKAYSVCDYNISITNQPHSEIAALAVFLDRLFKGKELGLRREGKIDVLPSKKGKEVIYREYSKPLSQPKFDT